MTHFRIEPPRINTKTRNNVPHTAVSALNATREPIRAAVMAPDSFTRSAISGDPETRAFAGSQSSRIAAGERRSALQLDTASRNCTTSYNRQLARLPRIGDALGNNLFLSEIKFDHTTVQSAENWCRENAPRQPEQPRGTGASLFKGIPHVCLLCQLTTKLDMSRLPAPPCARCRKALTLKGLFLSTRPGPRPT
jgi:hypothetical protein